MMKVDAKRASILLFGVGLLGGAIAFGVGVAARSGQIEESLYASVNRVPDSAPMTKGSDEAVQQISATAVVTDQSGKLSQNFIAKIEPAIVEINCYSHRNFVAQGSGISFINKNPADQHYYIYSNFHVYSAAYFNGKPPDCFAVFPQPPYYAYNAYYGDYAIALVDSRYDSRTHKDWAVFSLGASLPKTKPLARVPTINDAYSAAGVTHGMCVDTDPAVGDSVTIFGYPHSGNQLGISETVTVGIISGVLPGPIYKTTAAIDHGNSGGIAILNKNGCSLGIPTLAAPGVTGGIGYIQSFVLVVGKS